MKGRVIEVPVQTNKALKEGDVLFRIDSKPHQYVVEQRTMLARWAPPAKSRSTPITGTMFR